MSRFQLLATLLLIPVTSVVAQAGYPSGISAAYQLTEGAGNVINDVVSGQRITLASTPAWSSTGFHRTRPSGSGTSGLINIPAAQIQGHTLLDVCLLHRYTDDLNVPSGQYVILGSENYNTRYIQWPTYRYDGVPEVSINGTTFTSGVDRTSGPACFTFVYTPAGLKEFVNGNEVQYTKQVPLTPAYTSANHPYFDVNGGTFTLGGGTSTGAWGLTYDLYSFVIGDYSSNAQVQQLYQADQQLLLSKGISVGSPSSGGASGLFLLTIGDSKQGSGGSQTLGNLLYSPQYWAAQSFNSSARAIDTSIGGQNLCSAGPGGIEGVLGKFGLPNQVQYPLALGNGKTEIVDNNAGTNDLAGGSTAKNISTCDSKLFSTVTSTGAALVRGTITPRYAGSALSPAYEANRIALNQNIRAGFGVTNTWIYDLDEDPYLNPPVSSVDSTIYPTIYKDGLHESAATYQYEGPRRALAYKWATGDTSPIVVPIKVNYWNLYQAQTTGKALTLITLYGTQQVCGVTAQVVTPYAGSGIVAITATVGDSKGTSYNYSPVQDLSYSNTKTDGQTGTPPAYGGTVQVNVTSTGANLSALTTGSSIYNLTICGN